MPNIFYLPNEKAYALQLRYTDGTKTCITDKRHDLDPRSKGQGRKVTWRVWQVSANKSRRKRPRDTKIGRNVVHSTGNAHQFQGQRQRSRSPGRHNVDTGSVSYLWTERPTIFKLGVQMEYEDPYRRDGDGPSPARSKVTIAMSHGASDRCWPISRERNILDKPKLVGRLSITRAITRISFEVKRQRSRSLGRMLTHSHSKCAISLEREGSDVKTRYTDGRRRHASPTSTVTSKVKVARSRDASDRCWPISRERNVLETPKLVGKLSTPRAIGLMRTSFKVNGKGQDHKSDIMLRPEVRHIFRTERPTNFHKSRTKSPRNIKIGK